MPRREIWRPAGASTRHEVSNLGRIRMADTREVVTPTLAKAGVLVVNLYSGGSTNVRAVHSIVAEAFLGTRPAGCMVEPRDGDKANCRADNLSYVSLGLRQPRAERDKGKYLSGKLTKEQALEIRRRARAGESVRGLADEFGVSPPLVSNIKHGRKWKDVD